MNQMLLLGFTSGVQIIKRMFKMKSIDELTKEQEEYLLELWRDTNV